MKKLRVVGIVLLSVIVVGLASFFAYSKLFQKKVVPKKTNDIIQVSNKVYTLKDYTDDKAKLAAMTPEQRTDQLLRKVTDLQNQKDHKGALAALKEIESSGIPSGYEVGVYMEFVREYGNLNDAKNKTTYEAKLKTALVAAGSIGPNDPLPDINSGGTP